MRPVKKRKQILYAVFLAFSLMVLTLLPRGSHAQQKDLGEVNILTAVSNMAFSALWVAEQLKYFEQEGVRAKITPAGGGAPCQNAGYFAPFRPVVSLHSGRLFRSIPATHFGAFRPPRCRG